jgi:hypothetical protein
MPDRGNAENLFGRFAVMAVMAMLIFVQFNDWFRHPNQLAGLWNDSIKNYSAPWYHVKYDSSCSVYQGMNYPFGDHINTVDGQPVLSNTWKALSGVFPGLADYFPAVSNLSILLSFLLGGFFMYLLFRAFLLPVWLSTALSAMIVFLSPQTLRVISHYGLAHVAAIPATLYFLFRFWRKPSPGGSLLIAGTVIFYALFHLYFLAVLGGLVGGVHLVQWLKKPDRHSTLRFVQSMAIQLGLPAGLLLTWMALTDPIPDRNAFPFGFFAYRAYPEGVFTSPVMPYFQWIDQRIFDIRNLDFEALSYVGLVTGVMFFVLLGGLLLHRWKALPFLPEKLDHRGFLHTLFIALLINLFFAFGLPFVIPGLEPLLDYTGPLRQFRSIGRFAWNCYYGWHLIGWVALYYWVERKSVTRRPLLYVALAITAYEAFTFARFADVELKTPIALENGQQLTDLPIDFDTYQAVQTVPHFNVGSGNFWWMPEGYISHHTLMLGVRTGMPTTSSLLTRTSPGQALQQLQLATPPYRMPLILEHFSDDRPLLLMWDKQQTPLSRQSYEHFLEDTEVLFDGERMKLLRVPLSSFATRLERRIQKLRDVFAADSLYYRHHDFMSTDSSLNFAYAPMDDGAPEAAYLGEGGVRGNYQDFTEVFLEPLPGMAPDSQYICAFWMYVKTPISARAEILLREVDPEDGALLQQTYALAHQSIQLVDTNGWALIEFPFTRKAAGSDFRLLLKNRDLKREDLLTDEFLLRPQSTDLYRRRDKGLWHNNRWWPEEVVH